jgi:GDP-L-fucose synthase
MNLAPERFNTLLNDSQPPLVNIGVGHDMTIRQLAEAICKVVGFEGELVFDASKPDGTPRKLLDVSRLRGLGEGAGINLIDGLVRAYQDFTQRECAETCR